MKKEFVVLGGVAVLIDAMILFGTESRGTGMFDHLVLRPSAVWLGGGGAIAAIISYVIYAGNGSDRWRNNVFRSLALAIAGGNLFFVRMIGQEMFEQDISEAKAYCENLIQAGRLPKTGEFWHPRSQEELVGEDELPRLLEGRRFYQPEAGHFEFIIACGFDRSWDYSSLTGTWSLST